MRTGLEGRVALVTGGSKGIGRAIAEALAAEGCAVAILSRNPEAVETAAASIAADHKVAVLPLVGDVGAPDAAHRSCAAVAERFGRLDVLVNNAGGPPMGSFLQHDDAAWADALDRNLLSVVRFTRAAVPLMKANAWGRIVNISSMLAREPTAPMVLSATARAGVSAFSKAVAAELGPMGITINTILRGGVMTERLTSLMTARADQDGVPFNTFLAGRVATVPVGRFAQPQEIAQLAVYLASEAAAFITGTGIAADGGQGKAVY
ncbi:MAG: SDR family oxidoreductase [Pseudomonadota bacterium]